MTKYEVQKGEWRVHYGEGEIVDVGQRHEDFAGLQHVGLSQEYSHIT
jgi:hypothetical protein